VQFVVATGGGTVVDTAKAVAAMIPARGRGQTCHTWLESGAADTDTDDRTTAASTAPAWPEALPLVCVPSTVGGAIAAASPRMALHALDEQLLAAPRWRPPCAPPTATAPQSAESSANAVALTAPWPYPRAAVFADHQYLASGFVPSAEALQLLAAQVVDLLLARAHNARRAQAKEEDDDDDDYDDDDDELANPAHDLDESVITQRLAGVLVGLRSTFATLSKDLEAAGEKNVSADAQNPKHGSTKSKEVDLREELMRLALELGVLAGLPQMGRAPGAALARALQPQHLPHEPWKRAMPALTAHALSAAPPLAAASGGVVPLALVDSALAAVLVAAGRDGQNGNGSDAVAEWDARVRRWVVAEAPALLVAAHALKPGKAGTAAATASLVPVGSASSPSELVESVQAACLVAQPTMTAAPGGLRDLWPGWPLPASNKEARGAFAKLLEPVSGAPVA